MILKIKGADMELNWREIYDLFNEIKIKYAVDNMKDYVSSILEEEYIKEYGYFPDIDEETYRQAALNALDDLDNAERYWEIQSDIERECIREIIVDKIRTIEDEKQRRKKGVEIE